MKEKETNINKKLTHFVEIHAYLLISTLYSTIREVENDINLEKQRSSSDADEQKLWYMEIYGTSKLVGPLGERPIHIFSLSANRFKDTNFGTLGSCMRVGIIKSIRSFVQEYPEEINAQYEKDYCAAVGNYINNMRKFASDERRNDSSLWSKIANGSKETYVWNKSSPFWDKIAAWVEEHNHQNSKCFMHCESSTSQSDSLKLTTLGLYEGETALLPMIAVGDLKTVNWMLSVHKHSPRLISLAAKGLFFRPIRRRVLTALGATEGWKYYVNLRLPDVNLDASSPQSYFGLNVLSFAVRCDQLFAPCVQAALH